MPMKMATAFALIAGASTLVAAQPRPSGTTRADLQ